MFEKFSDFLQKYLMPLSAKLSSNKELTAVKDGMIVTVPATIFGAIALILTNIPYLENVAPDLKNWLGRFFEQATPITIGLIALLILLGIANSYSKQLKEEPIYGILVAVISFLALTIFSNTGDALQGTDTIENVTMANVIPTSVFSSTGIFTAIIVSLVSIRVYHWIKSKKWTIKMPEAVPPNVSESFTALIPISLTILLFIIIRNLFLLTDYQTFQNFIYEIITAPLLTIGNSVWAVVIFILIQQILWFFGIHGTNVVMAVWSPILLSLMTANMEAYSAGKELPYILSQTFWQVYSAPFLLCVPILLLFTKSAQSKAIGKLSVIPALFSINEPYLFGLPVILNPILFIPFIGVYLLQFIIMYVLAQVGIIPIPVVPVPWTTPIILSGLLSTNFNVMGAVAQVISLAVGLVLWYPFIKILDKSYLENEKKQENDTITKTDVVNDSTEVAPISSK